MLDITTHMLYVYHVHAVGMHPSHHLNSYLTSLTLDLSIQRNDCVRILLPIICNDGKNTLRQLVNQQKSVHQSFLHSERHIWCRHYFESVVQLYKRVQRQAFTPYCACKTNMHIEKDCIMKHFSTIVGFGAEIVNTYTYQLIHMRPNDVLQLAIMHCQLPLKVTFYYTSIWDCSVSQQQGMVKPY